MQQLELFPNEFVRFATELSFSQFYRLKETRPEDFYRVKQIRDLVNIHKQTVMRSEARLAKDINEALSIQQLKFGRRS